MDGLKIIEKSICENTFKQKEKGTYVKVKPWVSANLPLNIWDQMCNVVVTVLRDFSYVACLLQITVFRPKNQPIIKGLRQSGNLHSTLHLSL